MKVSVIGQGYVGLNVAIAAASVGHQIYGIDINLKLISELNVGITNVPGITRGRILKLIESNNYFPTDSFSYIQDSEIVVICVPTPLGANREPDLEFLEKASKVIGQNITRETLVVNESTSFPGTLRNFIKPIIEEFTDVDIYFASAPERVDPGNDYWNLSNTPRVIAGLTETATLKAVRFYSTFCAKVHEVATAEVAEASKLFENTFRQVNIALSNEFYQIAHSLGFSAYDAILAASTKPFGFLPFFPSIGVGGHCIPVDPSYLSYSARTNGVEAKFINLANDTNLHAHKIVLNNIKKLFDGKLMGLKIQVAGIAYKPNTPDLRESPALLLIKELRAFGANVTWCDPLVGSFNGEHSQPLVPDVDLGLIVVPHKVLNFTVWKNSNTKVFDLSSTSENFGWKKFF